VSALTRAELASLYDAHVKVVRSVLARLCSVDDARLDDLTQEVFLRAWRSDFRGQSSAKTWLCRIAKNLAIDTWRARKETVDADTIIERLPSPGVDPTARVQALEMLARLPFDDQLLLVLACVEEWSMTEIGEVLEIPAGTVKSRLFALRQQLRAQQKRGVG
jgi:RNA polymerase sigma-70 factor (ECF subfamily)